MDITLSENFQLGRFKFERLLGQGGMGTVYLANDTQLQRKVAIKCVNTQTADPKLAQRLRVEAKLLAQLNHPNIVQLFDVIEDKQVIGLVMEYVEGTTLLRKRDELLPSQEQCLDWLSQISIGLKAAHNAGIIHCDLKPANVLVSDTGVVKIADFGIAKARLDHLLTNSNPTDDGKISGSYFSLSPEQAEGRVVDFRSDLFSLGILSYLLITLSLIHI